MKGRMKRSSMFPCQEPGCNYTCMSHSARIKHHEAHKNKKAKVAEPDRMMGGGMEDMDIGEEDQQMGARKTVEEDDDNEMGDEVEEDNEMVEEEQGR